ASSGLPPTSCNTFGCLDLRRVPLPAAIIAIAVRAERLACEFIDFKYKLQSAGSPELNLVVFVVPMCKSAPFSAVRVMFVPFCFSQGFILHSFSRRGFAQEARGPRTKSWFVKFQSAERR